MCASQISSSVSQIHHSYQAPVATSLQIETSNLNGFCAPLAKPMHADLPLYSWTCVKCHTTYCTIWFPEPSLKGWITQLRTQLLSVNLGHRKQQIGWIQADKFSFLSPFYELLQGSSLLEKSKCGADTPAEQQFTFLAASHKQ